MAAPMRGEKYKDLLLAPRQRDARVDSMPGDTRIRAAAIAIGQRIENGETRTWRVRLGIVFESQTVLHSDTSSELPVILRVEGIDVLRDVGWRRQGLFIITAVDAHQGVGILVTGCGSAAPPDRVVLEDSHVLAPVVLLVVQVLVVEAVLRGVGSEDLGQVRSDRGDRLYGDHVRVKVMSYIAHVGNAAAPAEDSGNIGIIEDTS